MIKAIEHNKRLTNEDGNFKDSEDFLTSSVFERLLLLPNKLIWKIVYESIFYNEGVHDDVGDLEEINYWPSWDANGTCNNKRVEPDLFLRFNQYDVIIEAKRDNRNLQSYSQWINQIIAYNNEYKDDNKKVIFIALDGLNKNTYTENVKSFHSKVDCELTYDLEGLFNQDVVKSNWLQILKRVKENLESSNINETEKKVLEQLVLVFSLFGFSTGQWFETIPTHYNIEDKGKIFIEDKFVSG